MGLRPPATSSAALLLWGVLGDLEQAQEQPVGLEPPLVELHQLPAGFGAALLHAGDMGWATAELLGDLLAGHAIHESQLLHRPAQHGLRLAGHQVWRQLWPGHSLNNFRLVNN